MKKVIVLTGGSGFIGSHLSDLLLKQNNKIICIDSLSTGNKQNIQPFLSNKNYTFIQDDVCSEKFIKKLQDQHIDQIYHLASPASVTYITKYPTETAFVNSIGTKNLLDLARIKKARILFASSSEVYGDPKEHPQKENYWGNVNSVGVRSGYDEGKRFGEALCMAYKRELGVSVGIARIFNTYGPNSSVKDTRVIPQFIMQALANKPITVHGDGSQTRSFCYVSDTAKGLKKIMDSDETGPFNIGNPDEYQIKKVAEIILGLTQSKSKIKYIKRPQDDPSVRKPDISYVRQKLTWSPQISFSDGLLKTIRYFNELLPNRINE